MAKKTKKSKKPVIGAAARLAESDKAQYETERMFAAEHIVQELLEGARTSPNYGHQFLFVFDVNDGDETLGSCELYGVDDARDEQGRGGAWVNVRIYVPNLDIDTEIES